MQGETAEGAEGWLPRGQQMLASAVVLRTAPVFEHGSFAPCAASKLASPTLTAGGAAATLPTGQLPPSGIRPAAASQPSQVPWQTAPVSELHVILLTRDGELFRAGEAWFQVFRLFADFKRVQTTV